MERITDFIERHKIGIFSTILIHLTAFMYFQIATYKEIVLYEPWDFRAMHREAPDDISISADQIITHEEENLFGTQENITSFVKDENDTREIGSETNTYYTASNSNKTPEQLEDEYEQSLKDKIREDRENGQESAVDDIEDVIDNTDKNKNVKPSEKAAGGTTMVSFSLKNRHPLNNNDWNVRNPGYTCGEVNGVVKVSIIVGVGGEVISASVLEKESKSATSCMKQQARKYALMSRFNYDANAETRQEGTITYNFVYRK